MRKKQQAISALEVFRDNVNFQIEAISNAVKYLKEAEIEDIFKSRILQILTENTSPVELNSVTKRYAYLFGTKLSKKTMLLQIIKTNAARMFLYNNTYLFVRN